MSEEAKAVQEVAKTARKGIETTEKVAKFFGQLMGEGFSELGGAFSDWAKSYRWKNLIRIHDEIEETLKKRNLEGKPTPIPPKYLIPVLENASLEDDENLQSMWAGLIANASVPGAKFKINKLFIEILSSFDPIDSEILIFLSGEWIDEQYNMLNGVNLNAEDIAVHLDLNDDDVKISISNLFRHGLIIDAWEKTKESLDYGYTGFRVNNPNSNFRLSHLGSQLLEACNAT